jgi:RNA polymerase sigma-70 factor, ECF subfamily
MPGETDQIWNDFHAGLRAFISRRVANPADVDDILQEVFLRIHRRVASLSHAERLVAWLFEVTRNAVADFYRSAARQRELPAGLGAEIDGAAHEEGSEEEAERLRAELSRCLGPMVRRLPVRYRETIALVELEGLTQRAAAERLGISLSGAKSRVQRGREKLRLLLDDCCRVHLDAAGRIAGYESRGESACGGCGPSCLPD